MDQGLQCKAIICQGAYTYQDISSSSVQDKRATAIVPINPPNGNLHDYVPFYFGPRSPALYTINRNPQYHRGVQQRDLIYLVSTVETIVDLPLSFVFTDGHAIMEMTSFYNNPGSLDCLDWDLIRGKYWCDTTKDPDRKRRRQAEFLIHQQCPWQQIQWIGVFDRDMRENVVQSMADFLHQPEVVIKRDWYYE